MNTWHIIACGKDDEVLLDVKETTEGIAKAKALSISNMCPHAIIVVRNPDGETHWAYRHGMEVDL